MTVIVMMPSTGKEYVNNVAIVLYVLMMMFFMINKPYKGANLYRLYGTLFVGIAIQTLLLVRSILANRISSIDAIGK